MSQQFSNYITLQVCALKKQENTINQAVINVTVSCASLCEQVHDDTFQLYV
jgi:hypothetical protein